MWHWDSLLRLHRGNISKWVGKHLFPCTGSQLWMVQMMIRLLAGDSLSNAHLWLFHEMLWKLSSPLVFFLKEVFTG